MKCPNCGKEIASDSIYCEYCGKKVDAGTADKESSKKKKIFFFSLLLVLLVAVVAGVVYHEKREAFCKANEEAQMKIEEERAKKLEEERLAIEAEEAAAKARAEEEERQRQEEIRSAKKAKLIKRGYVDLGLPSGTLWKKRPEEDSSLSYKQAMKKYGSQLPSKEQWLELIENCKWEWYEYTENTESVGGDGTRYFGFRMVQGYKVYGKNGKYINLTASDYGIGGKREWYYSSSATEKSIWYTCLYSGVYECREWNNFFDDEKNKDDWWCWYFSVELVSQI